MSAAKPWFIELLEHPELTRRDVFVWGVVAANTNTSPAPTMDALAREAGVHKRDWISIIVKLRRIGLVKHTQHRGRTHRSCYVATGPRYCCEAK